MPTQTNISSQTSTTYKAIGNNFIQLDKVDSTNTYAMKQIQANLAEHGYVYFAFEQTAGKGQQHKTWQSQAGNNIIMSITLHTQMLLIHQQFYLSIITALATHDLLKKYTTEKISIKWPNDIFINDSKAAGILIENKLKGKKWQWSVVGIGVNIIQTVFASDIKNATSLKQVTNKNYNVTALAKELCVIFENRWQQLLQQQYSLLLKEYNELLYKQNCIVNLKKNNISFFCTIKAVNEKGKLIVENGLQDEFDFGEVTWVL